MRVQLPRRVHPDLAAGALGDRRRLAAVVDVGVRADDQAHVIDPQPGLVERSLGVKETNELAVMCDTFRPLRLTTLARDLDDPSYAYSWYEETPEHAVATTGD